MGKNLLKGIISILCGLPLVSALTDTSTTLTSGVTTSPTDGAGSTTAVPPSSEGCDLDTCSITCRPNCTKLLDGRAFASGSTPDVTTSYSNVSVSWAAGNSSISCGNSTYYYHGVLSPDGSEELRLNSSQEDRTMVFTGVPYETQYNITIVACFNNCSDLCGTKNLVRYNGTTPGTEPTPPSTHVETVSDTPQNTREPENKTMLIIILAVVPAGCVLALIICVAVMSLKSRKNQIRTSRANGHTPLKNDSERVHRTSRYSGSDGTQIEVVPPSEEFHPPENGSVPTQNIPTGAIPLQQFEDFFDECQIRQLFKQKFKAIPTEGPGTTEVARQTVNVIKNRYKNIIPYDENRVPLPLLEDSPESDYINASFVTGYGEKKGYYIAAQGPKPETVNDFWRMIVTYDVTQVVMLTRCQENIKVLCEEYWPSDVGNRALFDTVVVKCDSLEHTAHFSLRSLSVSCKGKIMHVRHYQMTTWADKTKPDSPLPMLDMMQRIRGGGGNSGGPLLVHCSAGAGRTGTYLALDCLLDQVAAEATLDVDGTISRLRTERPWMVQTLTQYVFIHEFLMTYLRVGGAAVNISHLVHSPTLGPELESFIEKQFRAVTNVTNKRHTPDKELVSGSSPDNRDKNRLPNVIAPDRCRAYLSLPVPGATDYINGVYLNTFHKTNDVIVTQIPLEDTVVDFWRLVHDHDVGLVVLLENINVLREMIPQYWPLEEEPSRQYGPLHVELTGTGVHPSNSNILTRSFSLAKPRRPQQTQHVTMYQLRSWYPDRSVPGNAPDILDLYDCIRHHEAGGSGRVLLQCLDGVSHCGLFCAGSHVVAQGQLWTDIDCPLAVLSVREQRKQFVINLEQYRFLYHLIQANLARQGLLLTQPPLATDQEHVYANTMSETVC